MGTISLVHIHANGKDSIVLATLYIQYDGYPTGVGADIKAALEDRVIVNGFNDPTTQLNGMECAGAWLIGQLKTGTGNVYLAAPNEADTGEEFVYHLYCDRPKKSWEAPLAAEWSAKWNLCLTVIDTTYSQLLYDGLLKDFIPEEVELEMTNA